jgi:hypothetical protein
MIGAILSFLFSIFGVFTILLGFVSFFFLPVIGLITPFKSFSTFFLHLAALPLNRAAIVVSEQDNVLFKQMSFTNIGLECINLDDTDKLFEDPDNALHHWLGIPFAFADEKHGILFDLRHPALGMRKQEIEKRGEEAYLATDEEYESFGVAKWVPAALEMPALHELVNLSAVRELVDGGERAEYPERGEEFYKHSRDPFADKASLKKFLYPSIAFSIPFFGIWIGVTQLGGPSETVGYGASVLWLLIGSVQFDLRDKLSRAWSWLKALDWFKIISAFLLITIPSGIFTAIAVFVSPSLSASILVTYLIGMALMPLLTILFSPSALIGGALSKLYFKLGFFGFQNPVMRWTPSKYEIVEHDSLRTAEQNSTEWYDLFGTVLGFTYDPEPRSWGAEHVPHAELEAMEPVADGGQKLGTSNLPAKYIRSDMKRDLYGGYIPKRLSDKHYYLKSAIAWGRFKNTAHGDKTLRKLLEAKDEHGAADDDVDEGLVFKATVVSGVFGALLGTGIFLIPAFL